MQVANKRLIYAHRLHKDIAELYSHNFNCSSSTVSVIQQKDEGNVNERGYLVLKIKIFEGPYRGGCYSFSLDIPECYPFRMVDIYASHPIWHPNIDLLSGKVTIPLAWSPVLTLNSLALGVQMIMLEPSAENPCNIEALSYYISDSEKFDKYVQQSIQGNCHISGIRFNSVLFDEMRIHTNENSCIKYIHEKLINNNTKHFDREAAQYSLDKKEMFTNQQHCNSNSSYDENNNKLHHDMDIQTNAELSGDPSLHLDQLSLQSINNSRYNNENTVTISSSNMMNSGIQLSLQSINNSRYNNENTVTISSSNMMNSGICNPSQHQRSIRKRSMNDDDLSFNINNSNFIDSGLAEGLNTDHYSSGTSKKRIKKLELSYPHSTSMLSNI